MRLEAYPLLARAIAQELSIFDWGKNTAGGYLAVSDRTAGVVFQSTIRSAAASPLLTQSAILSLVRILSATSSCIPSAHSSGGHSGHRIGNTICSSGARPVPSGSSLLAMYWERQPTQYECLFGQGS
jgi:hypothetical protein